MIVLLVFVSYQVQQDTPRLGETPTIIFDLYSQEQAIRTYAEHAATIAVDYAARTQTTDEEFEIAAARKFSSLLRNHPTHPIYSRVTATKEVLDVTFTVEEDIILHAQFGDEPAALTTKTTGTFNTWLVPEGNNPYFINSLFGKRDLRSSPNHGGVDIPEPLNMQLVAPEAAIIRHLGSNSVWFETINGWTCAFLHVQPVVEVNDHVAEGEIIAQVTQDYNPEGRPYPIHLDFRCYNTDDPMRAAEAFDEEHVGTRNQPPQKTTYALTFTSPITNEQAALIDPYCLFNEAHKKEVVKYYNQHEDVLRENRRQDRSPGWPTGFSYREGSTTEQKLEETCNAYVQAGILNVQQVALSEVFFDQVIQRILEHEGRGACVYETRYNEWSRFGVRHTTYVESTGKTHLQKGDRNTPGEVCEVLTEEQAVQILRQDYIFRYDFDQLPPELLPVVVDAGVNQGQPTARGMLLYVLYTNELIDLSEEQIPEENEFYEWWLLSEKIGMSKQAEAAFQGVGVGVNLVEKYIDRRIQRYEQSAESNEEDEQYLTGWIRRARSYSAPLDFRSYTQASALRGIASHQFKLEKITQLQEHQQRSMRNRQQARNQLQNCLINNDQCIALNTHRVGLSPITEYPRQLADVAGQCAELFSSDCSCYVPLPRRGQVTFIANNTVYNSDLIDTNWLATPEGVEQGEGERDMQTPTLFLEQKQAVTQEDGSEQEEIVQTPVHNLTYISPTQATGSIQETSLRGTFVHEVIGAGVIQAQRVLFEDTEITDVDASAPNIWLRADTSRAELFLSQQRQTPACEGQTVLEVYENPLTEERVRVNHRIPTS